MTKRQLICTCLLLVTIIALSGCKLDTNKLIHPSKDKQEKLIKVEVFYRWEKRLLILSNWALSNARVYVDLPPILLMLVVM